MVLIVDDSAAIRRVTKNSLELMGFLVDEAQSAENALEILETKAATPYQLIITDYNMPGMNGVQLTAKIREMARYQLTPIILLTTEDAENKIEAGKKAGINSWIQKPYKFNDLSIKVKELLLSRS